MSRCLDPPPCPKAATEARHGALTKARAGHGQGGLVAACRSRAATAFGDDWLGTLGEDIGLPRGEGKQSVIVSSGAVALGRRHLAEAVGAARHKQAAAAAGQTLLMQAWEAAFAPYGIPTAQLLLTFDDTEQRRRWLNARATIAVLLAQGALPVINENDSVATDELRYGDNDRLSARVAQMIKGRPAAAALRRRRPLQRRSGARPRAAHVAEIAAITGEVEAMAAARRAGSARAACARSWSRPRSPAAPAARP